MGKDYASMALSVETSLLAETFTQKTDEGVERAWHPELGQNPPWNPGSSPIMLGTLSVTWCIFILT